MGTAVEIRSYQRQDSVVFCKTKERFGGLSNMAPGFRLRVNGIDILTSEALYQACRFPHLPDVQRMIIDQKSPMTAKMKSKPYRSQSRADWDAIRVRIMRWCLRVKLAWNWKKFRDLLVATGDRPIVEESRKDDFWGTKVRSDSTLVGANVLGRLLMELRRELRGSAGDSLLHLEPPAVTDFLLYGEPIRLVERANAGASAEDLFTTRDANRFEVHTDDPLGGSIPFASASQSSRIATRARPESGGADGVSANSYARRLIEVDLPIKEISAHARREKSIRYGHISTLHIWWARRPLAACRAVLCAALWPDPADPLCSERFRKEAAKAMRTWRNRRGGRVRNWAEGVQVRQALLAFIAEFANWDNSTDKIFLKTARRLTQVAHESLGGVPGTRPLIVDPFAGGGAIPHEALRIGADAFASDLNPVAVLLNKVVLEYMPKYGAGLADEVRRWGVWVREKATAELSQFYPGDADGAVPIAYLWARTIRCEGPGCGAAVPLMRSLWLSKKRERSVGMRLVPRKDRSGVEIEIVHNPKIAKANQGTVRRGSATCPCCGYTTAVTSVRAQLKARRGGGEDARLLAIRQNDVRTGSRSYRLPTTEDQDAARAAGREMARRESAHEGPLCLVPNEPLPPDGTLGFRVQKYGMDQWGHLFSPRQALTLVTLVRLVREAGEKCRMECDAGVAEAVATCLGLAVDRLADFNSSLCVLNVVGGRGVVHTFGRQALPMVWDFMETNPFNDVGANWNAAVNALYNTIVLEKTKPSLGHTQLANAKTHPLPDDAANAFITDPPYYDAVPYADLSDFFFVWLRRTLGDLHSALFGEETTPKDEECIVDETKGLTAKKFEDTMLQAMAEGRRVLAPAGIGLVVFAHKSTAGWEAQLQAMIDAGWIITASWPIDTERPGRLRAQNSAALASSVHLVCRPREKPDGSLREDAVGDWRAILRELPERIHAWMPRLANEGVVGADAIFACLGPALEIFSRYSRVEKASGERVDLRDFLEQVWAAVAREALSMIFEDADATGLEEDARLTAMWLWTLSTSANRVNGASSAAGEEDKQASVPSVKSGAGFKLEFDAARKIAQGLGAHLEGLGRVVEIKGHRARLLSVSERTRHLFGKEKTQHFPARRAKRIKQLTLFEELEAAEKDAGWGDIGLPPLGDTTLDRVHQAMVLFAAGRGETLKRFLVEEGVGRAATFWKLAQSLSALYPNGTDEKRWVDGVLARKKGLGL